MVSERARSNPWRSLGVPKIGSIQSLMRELVTELSELDMDAENTAASTSPRRPVLVKFTTNETSALSPFSMGVGGGNLVKKQASPTPIARKNANCKNTMIPLIPSAHPADDWLRAHK